MVYFIFLRDAELSVCKSSCCEIEKRLELKLLILVWPAVYELLQFYGFYCRQDIRIQLLLLSVRAQSDLLYPTDSCSVSIY